MEAMACGTAAVVSQAGSLPEVCGEAAGYFDPLDVASIREALGQTLEDERYRQSLIEMGTRRAAEFTWEKTADRTLRVFEAL